MMRVEECPGQGSIMEAEPVNVWFFYMDFIFGIAFAAMQLVK